MTGVLYLPSYGAASLTGNEKWVWQATGAVSGRRVGGRGQNPPCPLGSPIEIVILKALVSKCTYLYHIGMGPGKWWTTPATTPENYPLQLQLRVKCPRSCGSVSGSGHVSLKRLTPFQSCFSSNDIYLHITLKDSFNNICTPQTSMRPLPPFVHFTTFYFKEFVKNWVSRSMPE